MPLKSSAADGDWAPADCADADCADADAAHIAHKQAAAWRRIMTLI